MSINRKRQPISIITVLLMITLSGCANLADMSSTTEDARVSGSDNPADQTVYVPVYLETNQCNQKSVRDNSTAPLPNTLPEEQAQALELLLEFGRLGCNTNSQEELRREHANAQVLFHKDKTLINRLRLVWYLSLLGPSAIDDIRFQALLEPLLAKNGGVLCTSPLRPLVETIQAQLNERLRQVRDEQKKGEALQQKLDALKAIEKQLLDRERRRP